MNLTRYLSPAHSNRQIWLFLRYFLNILVPVRSIWKHFRRTYKVLELWKQWLAYLPIRAGEVRGTMEQAEETMEQAKETMEQVKEIMETIIAKPLLRRSLTTNLVLSKELIY
jgi:hypothetical protein